jgi:hypothetical protein
MAESRWRWNSWEWEALLYFRLVAADGAGYELRGVRGWAHFSDVQEVVRGGLFEVLPLLYARGLLDHADVRAPSRTRPEWVYRIAERGVRVADARDPTPHAPIRPPPRAEAEPAVYAPSRQRGALQLLRAAYEDPAVPVRFGGRGWITGRELGARAEAANRARGGPPFFAVDATDLRWLVDKGLCERRNDPDRPIVWRRATALGRSVYLLDWKSISAEAQRSARISTTMK